MGLGEDEDGDGHEDGIGVMCFHFVLPDLTCQGWG